MIEKLKPQVTWGVLEDHIDDGSGTITMKVHEGEIELPLCDAELKINEIIDIVNLLLQPHEATARTIPLSKAPKKRTAKEVLLEVSKSYEPNGSEFFDGVIDFYGAILKAFDREGIE